MTTLNEINRFLAPRKMAVAGASRNPKKFGGIVFKELQDRGFELYPINPKAEEILGIKCYKTVDELPADVDHLYVVAPKYETELIVHAAVRKGIKMVWIQRESDTPEAVKSLEDAQIPVVYNKCIMMFAEPVKGAHRFHRFLMKTFGGYPKLVISAN